MPSNQFTRLLLPTTIALLFLACTAGVGVPGTGSGSSDDDGGGTGNTPTPEDCPVELDLDADGFCPPADCNDTDPFIHPAQAEACGNGRDDDCDDRVDCADDECLGHELCQCEDPDGDGYCPPADCDDTDPFVNPGVQEACANLRDDDCDGDFDCDDTDCETAPLCAAEDCADGIDNDADGLTDCDDPDCAPAVECRPELCGNGIDDDNDGAIDCADSECAGSPLCQPEDCSNGSDDDADGLIDCADPDCNNIPPCAPENCTNGIDDDGDGNVDCSDSQCTGNPICQGSCNPILNGGFESGQSIWVETANIGNDIIQENTLPRSGQWYARFGSNLTPESLYQEFVVPEHWDFVMVEWWFYITTEENSFLNDDVARVTLQDTAGTELMLLGTWSHADENGGYQRVDFNIAAFRGQTVRLHWLWTTNFLFNTGYRIDDVSISCF